MMLVNVEKSRLGSLTLRFGSTKSILKRTVDMSHVICLKSSVPGIKLLLLNIHVDASVPSSVFCIYSGYFSFLLIAVADLI